MSAFESVHHDAVVGKLTCFDRLIFKGHLTRFYPPGGMKVFLSLAGVLLKDFGSYVSAMSEAVKDHAKTACKKAGRPYIYLGRTVSTKTGETKEQMAREIAEKDKVAKGLVCVLAAVEPCMAFDINKNAETHKLEVVRRKRACLHFYYYFMHEKLGFCHVRVQSWFPFEVQVWVNGREMLSRELVRRRVGHQRYLNAIVSCESWALAARLAEQVAKRRWVRLLDGLAGEVNPHLGLLKRSGFGPYWWVIDQAEIATDVVFSSRRALQEILPSLIAHAASMFSAEDVLGFLGRKLTPQLKAEVTTDARRRPEGWRVKHKMARNSIKVYDKANVLRVEVTINDPTQFRVLRMKEGHRVWCPMRKGVANLSRYLKVGAQANEAYLDALSTAHDNRAGIAVLDRHTKPIRNRGHRHPRLSPINPEELALFKACLAGEHAIAGFKNEDITKRLHPRPASSDTESRRRCQQTSRRIAKLRGHGLVAKIPRRRRYRVTPYGQRFMTAAIALHDKDFPAAYARAA